MMASFQGKQVACPECPPFGKDGGRRHQLEKIEDNYHGTGEDVGLCLKCRKAWWIGYTPVIGERAEDWEG